GEVKLSARPDAETFRRAPSGDIRTLDLSPAPGGHRRIDRRDYSRLRIQNGQARSPFQIGDEGGAELGIRAHSDLVRAVQEERDTALPLGVGEGASEMALDHVGVAAPRAAVPLRPAQDLGDE